MRPHCESRWWLFTIVSCRKKLGAQPFHPSISMTFSRAQVPQSSSPTSQHQPPPPTNYHQGPPTLPLATTNPHRWRSQESLRPEGSLVSTGAAHGTCLGHHGLPGGAAPRRGARGWAERPREPPGGGEPPGANGDAMVKYYG